MIFAGICVNGFGKIKQGNIQNVVIGGAPVRYGKKDYFMRMGRTLFNK